MKYTPLSSSMISPLDATMISIASFGVLSSIRIVTVPAAVWTLSEITTLMCAWRASVRKTRLISSPWKSLVRVAVGARAPFCGVDKSVGAPGMPGAGGGGTLGTETGGSMGAGTAGAGAVGGTVGASMGAGF